MGAGDKGCQGELEHLWGSLLRLHLLSSSLSYKETTATSKPNQLNENLWPKPTDTLSEKSFEGDL